MGRGRTTTATRLWADEEITWLVTIFVIIIAGGLYGYSLYLKGQIDNKTQLLTNDSDKLTDYNLGDIKVLSYRLKMVNNLINNHQNIGSLFNVLENSTDSEVSYDNLSLVFDEAKGYYNLSLQGSGKSYNAVIRQVDLFKSQAYSNYFSNVIVKSLVLNKTNGLDFNLVMDANLSGVDKLKDNKLFNLNNDFIADATSTLDKTNASTTNFLELGNNNAQPKVGSINSGNK